MNGVRTRGNNFQIDGADNNDAFQNTAAVNQGGVVGHRRHAAADRGDRPVLGAVGRPGGDGAQRRVDGQPRDQVGHERLPRQRVLLQPPREAVGATRRLRCPAAPKRPIRNNQYGFSLGGPIVHNKTFFFSTLEVQKLTAGNTIPTTAPSDAWVASATQLLNQFNVPVNPVSTKLLALWPADSRTVRDRAELRQHRRQHLQQRQRHRQGRSQLQLDPQPVGALLRRRRRSGGARPTRRTSPTSRRCPAACTTSRWSAPASSRSHLVNQLVVGYNYFKQTFNSNDFSADPLAMGFNTGVTDPALAGPPNITINGFAGGRRHAAARAASTRRCTSPTACRTRPARIR